MKVKYISLLLLLQMFLGHLHAQQSTSDSLWCDRLNEIIKCASIDLITDRISKNVRDSDYIAEFRPNLTLTSAQADYVKKEYGKVTYLGYFYSTLQNDDKLLKQFNDLHKRVMACLQPWDEFRLKNRDSTLAHSVPEDYFITNSEDETTVRIDISYDKDTREYHLRLFIY